MEGVRRVMRGKGERGVREGCYGEATGAGRREKGENGGRKGRVV